MSIAGTFSPVRWFTKKKLLLVHGFDISLTVATSGALLGGVWQQGIGIDRGSRNFNLRGRGRNDGLHGFRMRNQARAQQSNQHHRGDADAERNRRD